MKEPKKINGVLWIRRRRKMTPERERAKLARLLAREAERGDTMKTDLEDFVCTTVVHDFVRAAIRARCSLTNQHRDRNLSKAEETWKIMTVKAQNEALKMLEARGFAVRLGEDFQIITRSDQRREYECE